MWIKWAEFCLDTSADEHGELVIVGLGMSKGYVENLETPLGLTLIMGLSSTYEEALNKETKRVEVRVLGPDLNVIDEYHWFFPLEIQSPEHYPEGWTGHAVVNAQSRLKATVSGHYLFELRADAGEPVMLDYEIVDLSAE